MVYIVKRRSYIDITLPKKSLKNTYLTNYKNIFLNFNPI